VANSTRKVSETFRRKSSLKRRTARRDFDLHQRACPGFTQVTPCQIAPNATLSRGSARPGPTKPLVSYQINLHHHPNQNDSNNGAPTLIEILQ
jgi:hypothetical protein